ncbi:hypothetical protein GQ53DRAFT_759919 [Thozetella sp. PMI_491]|nr:hypothetical protein GQ53DRAFT_759919 [Thozetella sp. PMI_491]
MPLQLRNIFSLSVVDRWSVFRAEATIRQANALDEIDVRVQARKLLGGCGDNNLQHLTISLAVCLCWIPIFAILSLCKHGRRRFHSYQEKKGWIAPDPEMQHHRPQPMMPQLRIPERVAARLRGREPPSGFGGPGSGSVAGLGCGSRSTMSASTGIRSGDPKVYDSNSHSSRHSRGSRGSCTRSNAITRGRRGIAQRPPILAALAGGEDWKPIATTGEFSSEERMKMPPEWKGKMPERTTDPLPVWHYPTSEDWKELHSAARSSTSEKR